MAELRPGDDVEIWTGPPSQATRLSYAMVRGLIWIVAKVLGRVEVVGAENVPTEGAFILAPVHRSNVDFALSSIVTTRPMRYMGKDNIWKSKALGRFVSMLGAFPVHRGSADRDALKACIDIVSGGSPLVMFPEGTRRSGPVVEDLFDGTAFVAARTRVPILPVGIGGSEAMMPKGAKMLKRSKLVLVVGDPIPAPELTEKGRVPRSAVGQLTARLHQDLQVLFDDAMARAGRPNPPRDQTSASA
ncbi:MAG TPA: lysophospholipid acyltransferase family protein [Acidimicrobiales bacterium]|nr:lysophospholipid acyltransferase family protein [Acidimicrobiales bacterium]